mgnify:CR=1 FL=1
MYAEDTQCNACTTTSPYIDNYISFAYEIISTLQTYANKDWSVFTTATNNLGNTAWSDQGTTTHDPLRWLEAIVDNLNKKAQSLASAWYVTSLITTEAVALDSWKSIGLLFQSNSLLRDWQKIDRVDQSVTNTLLDLGNAWVFIRLWFKPGLQERIKSILEKYVVEWIDENNISLVKTKCIDLIRYEVKYLPEWICLLSHGCTKEEFIKTNKLEKTNSVGVFVYQKIK